MYAVTVSATVSSVSTTGRHKGQPYVSDPGVKRFIQWTKTLEDNVVLQKTAVGGHYCYPRPPREFSQSLEDAESEENKQRIVLLLFFLILIVFLLLE